MTLIKSISGIRGTIGGQAGDNLTPIDVVNFVSGFCEFLSPTNKTNKIVIGRDARISGEYIKNLSIQIAIAMGFEVIDLDLTTTPTVEIAVIEEKASGGIIITASHNPKEWNALKLLNHKGEFINEEDGEKLLHIVNNKEYNFKTIDKLGKYSKKDYLDIHINKILAYPLVDKKNIENKNFTIVVDAINSSGALYIKSVLANLGVKNIIILNDNMNGHFAHNPEPLEEHLTDLKNAVIKHKAHLGIAVDPDVDRLCFINEDGSVFGEEYTLVAIADYFLKNRKGNTVNNLCSTNALKNITEQYGGECYSAKIGEVNVVTKMKAVNAIIGGEGNGGIIVPDFHYGRDALIGVALFLSHLAKLDLTMSELRKSYPNYFMYKTKIQLTPSTDIKQILSKIKNNYPSALLNEEDGLKIIFPDSNEWIQIRSSNTEPIIRIYTESKIKTRSKELAENIKVIIDA